MRDIDPELKRLREIEARIALLEVRLVEQNERLDGMGMRGLHLRLGWETREIMLQSLHNLERTRDLLLDDLERSDPAAPAATGALPSAPR